MRSGFTLIELLIFLAALGASRQDRVKEPKTDQAKTPAAAPERLDIRGTENSFRVSPRIYSGGEPRGAEAFAALKKLGVKTVISVDGAAPDVEAARKVGIRYVHLPIGYDGIPREQSVRIIK